MLRKTLVSACLLIASGSALANDQYVSGHGVQLTPRVSITLGGGHINGGYSQNNYARPHSDYVPPPAHAQPIHYNNNYRENKRHYQRQDNYRSEWRGNGQYQNGNHNRGRSRGHNQGYNRDHDRGDD